MENEGKDEVVDAQVEVPWDPANDHLVWKAVDAAVNKAKEEYQKAFGNAFIQPGEIYIKQLGNQCFKNNNPAMQRFTS
jgi:hypothetical protein